MATPPEMQDIWPEVQVSVHVIARSERLASGTGAVLSRVGASIGIAGPSKAADAGASDSGAGLSAPFNTGASEVALVSLRAADD